MIIICLTIVASLSIIATIFNLYFKAKYNREDSSNGVVLFNIEQLIKTKLIKYEKSLKKDSGVYINNDEFVDTLIDILSFIDDEMGDVFRNDLSNLNKHE